MEKRAIILAAGRGSRMEGLTEATHKCLLEVDEEINREANRVFSVSRHYKNWNSNWYRKEQLAGYGSLQFYNSDWSGTQMVHSLSRLQSGLKILIV